MTTSTFTPTATMGVPQSYGQPGLDQIFGQQVGFPQQQPFGQQHMGQQTGQHQFGQQNGQQFGQQGPQGYGDPSTIVLQQLPQLLWQAQQSLVGIYQVCQVLQQLTQQVNQSRQFPRQSGLGW